MKEFLSCPLGKLFRWEERLFISMFTSHVMSPQALVLCCMVWCCCLVCCRELRSLLCEQCTVDAGAGLRLPTDRSKTRTSHLNTDCAHPECVSVFNVCHRLYFRGRCGGHQRCVIHRFHYVSYNAWVDVLTVFILCLCLVRTCFVSDFNRGLKIQEAKFNMDGSAEVCFSF